MLCKVLLQEQWQISLISGTVVLSTALTAGVVWVIFRTIKNSKKED